MPDQDNTYSAFTRIFEPGLIEKLKTCPLADFNADHEILSQGSYVRQIPLVVSGLLKVFRYDEKGKEILIYEIKPGESCILSLTACITGHPSKINALAESDTRAIIITEKQVKDWINQFRSWRNFVMEMYYDRLSSLIDLFDLVAFKNVDHRLVEKLRQKSTATHEIRITHQQLADELGTAREVVSRLLKQLEKEQKIVLSRGKIKILSL